MELMHKETRYISLDYDKEKTAKFIGRLINAGQFVYINDDCLMLGQASETFFGKSLAASDLLLYVKKESRGKGFGNSAISEFIEWADSLGCDSVAIAQSTGINNKEFNSLAKANGLKKVGECFAR